MLASPDWMEWVSERGLRHGPAQDVTANRLVLIGRAGAPAADIADLAHLLAGQRLAMALVAAVPAGIYGKAALAHLGLWDAVQANVVQADNVRAALALVALGAVPYGIVYATDALAEPRVTVIARLPEDSHPPIRYPVAALSVQALPFLTFLRGPAAQDRLRAAGFLPLSPNS